jgi:DNA processing protein
LIQQGAQLVQSSAEILAVLAPQVARTAAAAPAAKPSETPENPLLAALGYEPTSLDALQARTGLPTDTLLVQLMTLELEGAVRVLPGGRYERTGLA